MRDRRLNLGMCEFSSFSLAYGERIAATMHNHIIESIGRWGVKSTPYDIRMNRVKGGDIIEVPESLRSYPISGRYARISDVSVDGIASVCEGMGSAHLLEDGSCIISGGPWWSIPVGLLTPKYELCEATYWNWGNNSPGAHQGVYYNIYRPVHVLTCHPDNDIKYRYATNEQNARKGKFTHEHPLDDIVWEVFLKGKECMGGEFLWVFKRK